MNEPASQMQQKRKEAPASCIQTGAIRGPAGTVSGRLRVVNKMAEAHDLEGCIAYVPRSSSRVDADDISLFHAMARGGVAGILCEQVGRADHSVVLVSELGIPCLSGIDGSMEARAGEVVAVVGENVVAGAPPPGTEGAGTRVVQPVEAALDLKINLGFPEVVSRRQNILQAVDGVGFMRLEFVMLDVLGGHHPKAYLQRHGAEHFAREISRRIEPVVQALGDRPVWVRTNDFSVNQLAEMTAGAQYERKEQNPMLGWRGIARSIEEREILEVEFLALRRLLDQGHRNIGVFPPMTRFPREYRAWKDLAERAGLGPATFGLMVETPAAALTFEEFVDDIEFMVFGSNDLTQFTLAIDRGNPSLQAKFDEKATAVLRLFERVIGICNENGVTSSIGGVAAADRDLVTTLMDMGISGFSVNPDPGTITAMQQLITSRR